MTCIKIVTKLNSIPDGDTLELLSDKIIDKVDEYVDNVERSFQIEMPTEEQISKMHYAYKYHIEVNTDKNVDSKELFDIVSVFDDVEIVGVRVFDKKFNSNQSCNNDYYWTNEGIITYYDGSTYIDPVYEFHTPEGQHYEVVYIPVYAAKFQTRDKEHYDNSGATYMWRCTSCWDNWMKATTIEEAIEEFEDMYKKKLWQSIENNERALDKAIESFASFDEYRWNKRW